MDSLDKFYALCFPIEWKQKGDFEPHGAFDLETPFRDASRVGHASWFHCGIHRLIRGFVRIFPDNGCTWWNRLLAFRHSRATIERRSCS